MTQPVQRRKFVKWVGGTLLLSACAPTMKPAASGEAAPAATAPAAAPAAQPTAQAAPAPAPTATLAEFAAVGAVKIAKVGDREVVISRLAAPVTGGASAGDVHLAAYSTRCTHAGCPVKPQGAELACPCHGSLFGLDGTVKKGPAARPLDPVALKIDGQGVFVG